MDKAKADEKRKLEPLKRRDLKFVPEAPILFCKACDGLEREFDCRGCGGYGYIAQLWRCACGRTGYVRPGLVIAHEKTTFFTIDGLEVIWRSSGSRCVHCERFKE